MPIDLISIVVGAIVLFVFFAILAVLIREGASLIFRLKETTYYQASEISVPVTLFLLLQLILGQNILLNIILAIICAIVILLLVRRNFQQGWKMSFLLWGYVILCIVVIFLISAYILYLTK